MGGCCSGQEAQDDGVGKPMPSMDSGVREETPAAVPKCGLVLGIHETTERLVHERRGLERLAGGLVRHPGRRELAEFIVDDRQQLAGCGRVALLDGMENAGHVTH